MKPILELGRKYRHGRRIREHLRAVRGCESDPVDSGVAGGIEQDFFVSGGTLPPDSASYLPRSADKTLFHSLRSGSFCYVLNSRQLGKSSLSVQTIARLDETGIRTAFLDLTRIGGKNLNAEQWYAGLAFELGRELNRTRELLAFWKQRTDLSPVQRLFSALREVALMGEALSPLVIFIDEIDATRSLPFDPDEFFAAIRECYNRRVADPALQRLTFCLLGVAVPSDLVRNRATTPFNIGERIYLEDFTEEELHPFASALGPNGKELVKRVHYWTNGHPFLSQSLCRAIVAKGGAKTTRIVDDVVREELFDYKARESNINLADVANIALHYDSRTDTEQSEPEQAQFRADVLSTYLNVLEGKRVVDDESNRVVVILKLSGIVKSDGRFLLVRNRIYEHVFDRTWIEEHMPEQELRRQRHSYLRGAWRTATALGTVIAIVAATAAFAWSSRMQAIAAKNRLDYQLYVSDMNSLRGFYEVGDTARIEQILNRYENAGFRGFEYGYWLGRIHDAHEEYTLAYRAPGKRETGHVSSDGREICIEDQLTRTATILNRQSKATVATVLLGTDEAIGSTKNRWIIGSVDHDRAIFRDAVTGRSVSEFREPHLSTTGVQLREHCDFAFIRITDPTLSTRAVRRVVVWDIPNGRPVTEFVTDLDCELFDISEDGRFVVEARGSRQAGLAAEIRTLPDGKVVDRFSAPFSKSLALSPKGDWILIQTDNGKRVFRDARRHVSRDVTGSEGPMPEATYPATENGRMVGILTGGRLCIMRVQDGAIEAERRGVFSVKPGASAAEYLASASTVRLFPVATPTDPPQVASGVRITRFGSGVINVFDFGGNSIHRLNEGTFAPAGNVSRGASDYSLGYNGRWQISGTPRTLKSTDGSGSSIELPFAPANWSCGISAGHIACWSPDQSLMVYSGPRKKTLWSIPGIKGIAGMWLSPDGSRLIVVRDGIVMTVYDAETGKILHTGKAHNVEPISVSFSADGRRFFTCGGDGRVVMWDLEGLRPISEFRGNDQERMTSADVSPDGRRVVTTNTGGAWQLWDVQSGVQLMNIAASDRPLSSAVFCEDGKRLLTAGDDGIVRLWRAIDRDPTTYVHIDPQYLSDLKR